MDRPRLSKDLVLSSDYQKKKDVDVPEADVFELPEKILQFGSGRFLRGFADFFVDKAIREGLFDGRAVVVQSTGTRRSNVLDTQDGLYTLAVQGLQDGEPVETYAVMASVSRALSANDQWADVLAVARNPELACTISNTTEVGITLDEDDRIDLDPPRSYPGKLTACLHARAEAFDYSSESGLVVIPCELIENNGETLKGIVLDLAQRWDLGERFTDWVKTACTFCNTLVDRIVTGKPSEETVAKMQEKLGYEDQLLTVAEVYRLWAIEGDAALEARLPFLKADDGIIVTDDITPYRLRKVRLLNGAHTTMVPTSYLSGNDTVRESLEDPLVGDFLRGAMHKEIVPSLRVSEASARQFADEVLDRFGNPYIEHLLLNITFQSTSKMRHRVVPSILGYYEKRGELPQRLLFGFAGYLRFMRGTEKEDGTVYGRRGEERYKIDDDQAPYFYDVWQGVDTSDEAQVRGLAGEVLRNAKLWGRDLTALPELEDTVAANLLAILQHGARDALQAEVGPKAKG